MRIIYQQGAKERTICFASLYVGMETGEYMYEHKYNS